MRRRRYQKTTRIGSACFDSGEYDTPATIGSNSLEWFMPKASVGKGGSQYGPHGRFKIVVTFEPEAKTRKKRKRT